MGTPIFKDVTVGPESIWAPKTQEVEIKISGAVVVAPGCEVTGTYSMKTTDGPAAGKLTIEADGSFEVNINGKFSKNPKDKDGTVYKGELTVIDAEGNGASKGFFVNVAHDRGK